MPRLPESDAASDTHLVIIPSYNSGALLVPTIAAARACWAPVWVVIDGSTDASPRAAEALAAADPMIRVLHLPINQGKGAAVRHGMIAASKAGFTHALVMDADGQHPPDRIGAFMRASAAAPDALIMGQPVFGHEAPWIRVAGRRLSNISAALMAGRTVGDTLFGFRVYPIAVLLSAMRETRFMRRFDFDPEAVVRLAWRGTKLIHLPAPVRYLSAAEGGISHFNYLRDNKLLVAMNVRLALTALARLPRTLLRR